MVNMMRMMLLALLVLPLPAGAVNFNLGGGTVFMNRTLSPRVRPEVLPEKAEPSKPTYYELMIPRRVRSRERTVRFGRTIYPEARRATVRKGVIERTRLERLRRRWIWEQRFIPQGSSS